MKKYNITVKGVTYEVTVEEVPMTGAAPGSKPSPSYVPASAPAPVANTPASDSGVVAPMPGTILDVNVTVGQAVKSGETLCTLEAMKMENTIAAPRNGTVAAIHTAKGANVNSGDLLFTLA